MASRPALPAGLGEAVSTLAALHCQLFHAQEVLETGSELEAARARVDLANLESMRQEIICAIDAMHAHAVQHHETGPRHA